MLKVSPRQRKLSGGPGIFSSAGGLTKCTSTGSPMKCKGINSIVLLARFDLDKAGNLILHERCLD